MKTLLLLLLLLLLFSPAYSETFEEEMNKDYHPQLSYSTKDSTWTGWNILWVSAALAGQVGDIVSTEAALDRGDCHEGNAASPGVLIALKVVLLGSAYWITEYLYDGHEDQQTLRNWVYGSFAVWGAGATAWNSTRSR